MSKIRDKIKLKKLFRVYATFSVAFLLSYAISGVVSPISNSSAVECVNGMISGTSDICGTDTTDVNVSITGAWTVSVSSAGTLGLNLTPTSSGVLNTATDNVNVYTNTPNGYQLYLNSTSGNTDIYNEDVLDSNGNLASNLPAGTNTNHFVATSGTKASPATLTNNTWGYTLTNLGDNPSQSTLNSTTFSKVELTSSSADSLISSGSKTTGAGDNLPVTYGFMADTKLTPGTYTTSVTYTAVAEVPSYTLSSITPNTLYTNDQTNKQVTIVTTTPVSELGLGDVTARITNGTDTVNLTNCTETTTEVSGTNYRAATCTYPGTLPMGYYNVVLTSSWHSATYTLTNGFRIKDYRTMSNITYMQDMNSDICENTPESTVYNQYTLKDSRGSYNTTTPANYTVIKAKDGNCWMTSNLNLYNKTVTSMDTDIPSGSFVIPNTSNWEGYVYDAAKVHRATSSGSTNLVYYNWCAAVGLTTTCNTTEQQNQSICPKNWQLPISGNYNTDKTYERLLYSYNINTVTSLIGNNYLGFNRYYGGWFTYASPAREEGQDNRCGFYTSTPSSVTGSLMFYYDNNNILLFSLNDNGSKGQGFNVRCVAR